MIIGDLGNGLILGTKGYVTRSGQKLWPPVERPNFLILGVCKWEQKDSISSKREVDHYRLIDFLKF